MPASTAEPITLRCHRCSQFIGEADEQLEFVGVVKFPSMTTLVAAPRLSWRCKCGWTSIYKLPLAEQKAV